MRSASGAEAIWIDTDISIGSPFREVDDGYALMLAFHSPELRIAGISTTYGNANLDYTDRVARDFIRRFGWKVTESQVHAGAKSARDSARQSDATDALSVALRAQRVTYIALGPLTNLAAFLAMHPQQSSQIERIIFLGGESPENPIGFGPNGRFRIHDANVFKDPAALRVILQSKIPISLVPIATAGRLTIAATDLRTLRAGGAPGSFLAKHSGVWLLFWMKYVGTDGGPVFDALAVIAAARPRLVSTETRYANLQKDGELAVSRQRTRGSCRVLYCPAFSSTVKAFLLQRLNHNKRGA